MSSNNTMSFDNVKNKCYDNIVLNSITVDLNVTRITVVCTLVNDYMRMKLDLWHCKIEYEIAAPCWLTLSE